MKAVYTLLLLLISHLAVGQNAIKSEADKMGKALLNKDYNSFVNYTYPKLMEDMGGREKMIETAKKQMEDVGQQGVKIISISYGEPSVILKEKGELQATLPQEMIFETAEGKVQAKSTVIAVSDNDGKHWYFIDPGERDLETVRISLPNISKKLVLPPNEPVKILK